MDLDTFLSSPPFCGDEAMNALDMRIAAIALMVVERIPPERAFELVMRRLAEVYG